jgi:hypothetical protein
MTRFITALLALLALAAATCDLGWAQQPDQPRSRHPEYELLGPNPPPVDSILNPNFIVSQESKVLEGSLWRGSYFPERLVGLDVGDVNGDRLNELAYATTGNIYVGVRNGEALQELASWKAQPNIRIISLDLYDTDGDGTKEIIVSAQADSGAASSMVLAYDGSKTLRVIADRIPWYIRAFGPDGSKSLAVQKGANTANDAFLGNVVMATFQNGKVVTSQKVPLPFGVNLFNFNIGQLGVGGVNYIATVTSDEHLNLKLFSGPSRDAQMTEKSGGYCGTINYVKLKSTSDSILELEYLPSRIVIADIDNDGGNELIVSRNSASGIPIFKNLRSFDGGLIEALKFTDISLVRFFSSTNLLPGPAVDYQLADFDNNGTKDLVVGVIITAGSGMLSDSRSIIVSYSNLYATGAGDKPGN